MKKKNLLLTALATIGLAAATIAQTVPNYVPTNGLVGWWPFNGNANDESGNNNNGTVNGATLTADRFGNANKAYSFNGNDNFIKVTHNNSFNFINKYTIALYFRLIDYSSGPGTPNSSGWTDPERTLISKPLNSGWADGSLNIKFTPDDKFIKSGSLGIAVVSTKLVPTLDDWHNLIVTYDGTKMKLFFDGNIKDSILVSGNMVTSTQDLFFGKGFNSVSNNWYRWFKGQLDDIAIYDRALTQQEITALYESCNLNASITPATALINAGLNAQFTANAADPNATFQWQSNADNFGWLNVPTNNFYSGGTSNSLTVSNIQLGNHNQPFRVIATAGNCVDTSATAFIQIADTCVNTVIDTNYVTVTDTNHVTVYDTVTTYISVTDTLFIDVNTVGLNSNPVVNTIKVFPNPSNSILNLNYGNYATLNNYRVKITNALGQTIYDQAITQPSETLDLSTLGGNGIYYLSIINPQGNVIETRKIVLQ